MLIYVEHSAIEVEVGGRARSLEIDRQVTADAIGLLLVSPAQAPLKIIRKPLLRLVQHHVRRRRLLTEYIIWRLVRLAHERLTFNCTAKAHFNRISVRVLLVEWLPTEIQIRVRILKALMIYLPDA